MTDPEKFNLSKFIKQQASALGFSHCGISKATYLREDEDKLRNWIENRFHGEMAYMENHFVKRSDPGKLLDGAQSVISVLYNYYPDKPLNQHDNFKISKYAYGKDYHYLIRNKLKQLISLIRSQAGEFTARAFTDSAPVFDRAWAKRAGLGWIGKNSCLINPQTGSFFFIGEIITDLWLHYDTTKQKDLCGGCTKCIDSCPTHAILSPGVIDSRKCISYLTIEYKEALPEDLKNKFNDWIFGCDICQDVCPWNSKAKPNEDPDLEPSERLRDMNKDKWNNLSRDDFNSIFKDSAVKRIKYDGLKRNINFVHRTIR